MVITPKQRNQTSAIARLVRWVLLAAITFSALTYGLYQVSRNHKFQLFGELIYRIETDDKVVALTFDDGPTVKRTEAVLEILKRENVKATF